MPLAISYAASRSSPGGWTDRTSPASRASAASKMRPLNDHSSARLIPTARGRNQLAAPSMHIPRRLKTKPNRAVSEARRTSIGSGKVAPKPTAAPLTAAMTGFRHRNTRSEIIPPLSRGTSPGRTGSVPRICARLTTSKPAPSAERSAPAQNARPRPVTTTARTASSSSTRSKTSTSSRSIVGSSALSLSGRSRVIVAIASWTSKLMVSNPGIERTLTAASCPCHWRKRQSSGAAPGAARRGGRQPSSAVGAGRRDGRKKATSTLRALKRQPSDVRSKRSRSSPTYFGMSPGTGYRSSPSARSRR